MLQPRQCLFDSATSGLRVLEAAELWVFAIFCHALQSRWQSRAFGNRAPLPALGHFSLRTSTANRLAADGLVLAAIPLRIAFSHGGGVLRRVLLRFRLHAGSRFPTSGEG